LTQDIDSKDFDVILYMNIKIDEKIEEKLSFNGNEFDLDFCIIYFQIEKLGDFHPTKPSVRLPNKKSAHVILVYKCDGYYKI
jgi:predicted component of type VI protein secretion system